MTGDVALDGVLTQLVPTTEDDLELLASWFADPDFVDNWDGMPLSRQQVAEKYLGRRRPHVGSYLVLAYGTAVGYAQYWHANATEGGIDMVLTPDAQGRGLGPDAAHALVTYLCSERGWRRVTVDPVASNLRAVRAWAKTGFHPLAREGRHLLMEWRTTG